MKWQVRTAAMFAVMSLIMAAIGLIVGLFIGSMWIGLAVLLIVSVVFNIYAFFGSKRGALRANKARIVTEAEEPRLYSIVKRVSAKAGVPMPEVGVSEFPMPNAFATGRNPKNAAVVATRGILNLLPDDQLEGVIAHEIAHVKNRDILVMSVASTMAAVLSFISRYLLWIAIGGREKNIYLIIAAVLMSVTIPIAALLVQLGVSRNREYLADETGARITENPLALANALRAIEKGVASPKNEYNNSSYESMWISNPIRKKGRFSSMFSTHPSMDDRVERLNALAEKMGKAKDQRPQEEDPFAKKRRSAHE